MVARGGIRDEQGGKAVCGRCSVVAAANLGKQTLMRGAAFTPPCGRRRADTGLTAAQHGGSSNLMEADVPADRSEIAAGSTMKGQSSLMVVRRNGRAKA